MQGAADHPTLRRSRCARHDAAVLHLHRRLQPALDIEQHPRTVRMTMDRLELQLPIDTVEVTLTFMPSGRLKARSQKPPPDDLIHRLRQHRRELLACLTDRDTLPRPNAERVAIGAAFRDPHHSLLRCSNGNLCETQKKMKFPLLARFATEAMRLGNAVADSRDNSKRRTTQSMSLFPNWR